MAELQPLKPRTPVVNLKHSSHDDEDGNVKGSEVKKLSPGSIYDCAVWHTACRKELPLCR
jgi:hypothetical protein